MNDLISPSLGFDPYWADVAASQTSYIATLDALFYNVPYSYWIVP